MGASTKRKKEKQKDFQKPKLKVGKTKPKADNHTDTSFKSKALVLTKQFATTADGQPPSPASQFSRHLSLLRHKSDAQRQESLAFLTSALQQPQQAPPEPVPSFLPKLQPLILDGSPAVRAQLLKLFKCLPRAEIQAQADQLLLYARAGMTHLAPEIRLFAMDVLEWLVDAAATEVVAAAGAWIKTLRCFMGLLGWQLQAAAQQPGWSAVQKPAGRPGTEVKSVSRFAAALAVYLRAGISPPAEQTRLHSEVLPLWWAAQNGLPARSRAFSHLDLFGAALDEENAMLEDREDRQRAFAASFEPAVRHGVEDMKKQGGELGRASAALRRALAEGMADFERDDEPAPA